MATCLELTFPWGKYHATPWRRSANEGIGEWPPSPWRILRALYSTWRNRAPELPAEDVEGLLRSLTAPPTFFLPPSGRAHSRHYYPDHRDRPDLVFDPFVIFPRDERVGVVWPTELPQTQHEAFQTLAQRLSYLGRADSVVTADVVVEAVAGDRTASLPATTTPGDVTVRVLCPAEGIDLNDLLVTTVEVRKQRRLQPPGTVWVPYAFTDTAVDAPLHHPTRRDEATTVRWALDAPALPSVHAAVAMADALRRAAMSAYGGPDRARRSATLAGKDANGQPLSGHDHAHYLATDDDGDGLLDHLTIWASHGLGDDELEALCKLSRLSGRVMLAASDFRPVRLGLEGYGLVHEVAPALAGPSSVWRSHTPFAPTQHPKRRDDTATFLRRQVDLELQRRGLAASANVTPILPVRGSWLAFRRRRLGRHPAEDRRAYGVEVAFDTELSGPLALGALSHFGLGLLIPVR